MTGQEFSALTIAIGVLKRESMFENAEILKALRTRLSLESRVLAEGKPIYQLRHCEYWEDVDGETWMVWVNDDDKRILFTQPMPDDVPQSQGEKAPDLSA